MMDTLAYSRFLPGNLSVAKRCQMDSELNRIESTSCGGRLGQDFSELEAQDRQDGGLVLTSGLLAEHRLKCDSKGLP
jgi:hypothetical protein